MGRPLPVYYSTDSTGKLADFILSLKNAYTDQLHKSRNDIVSWKNAKSDSSEYLPNLLQVN
jgi:hypothetical protein